MKRRDLISKLNDCGCQLLRCGGQGLRSFLLRIPAKNPSSVDRKTEMEYRRTVKQFRIEIEKEDDGQWIAEISALPGGMCYGATKIEATRKVEALALRILADRVESGK